MAGGHADGPTRTPVRGATWQVRMAGGRTTSIVGPSNSGGTVTQLANDCAPYLSAPCPDISSVWDYVPHISYLLQATWTHDGRQILLGRRRSRGPESRRSSNQHVRLMGI